MLLPQAVGAVIVGAAITSLPWVMSKINIEGLWPINFVLTPGFIVAFLVSGNVHDLSLLLALAVTAAFWSWLSYRCFGAFRKR